MVRLMLRSSCGRRSPELRQVRGYAGVAVPL
jgi:hypothetical protein